jgi:hypothetical protein
MKRLHSSLKGITDSFSPLKDERFATIVNNAIVSFARTIYSPNNQF